MAHFPIIGDVTDDGEWHTFPPLDDLEAIVEDGGTITEPVHRPGQGQATMSRTRDHDLPTGLDTLPVAPAWG